MVKEKHFVTHMLYNIIAGLFSGNSQSSLYAMVIVQFKVIRSVYVNALSICFSYPHNSNEVIEQTVIRVIIPRFIFYIICKV